MLVPAVLSAQVQLQGPRNSADMYSGVVYGPIDQNDTLWRIATRYKQDSEFSVYQTMLAIYELNQQAFENNNFNTMVNGATLQLPSDRFIERMDPQRARAKAETDDRAFGRPNSVQSEAVLNEVATQSATPEVPLVNQEDLSATKQELQQQLNALNRQQTVKFDEVKDQVSSSITGVQALLDENRRLYERIDQVNQDISDLRNKVEGEVQDQIDQQLALQKEIIDLVKQAEQRQLDREAQSIWTSLTSPAAVITLSSIFTIGMLVLLGLWLLRKPKTTESDKEDASQTDIVDDELVIGEMDEDDDDLLAAFDQPMDDDDILSSDLEDGLDELGIGDSDFDEADDMLVPDADSQAEEAKPQAQVISEDVSFDADSISLDDDDFENQEIDLKPKVSETPDTVEQKQRGDKVVEDLTSDLDIDDFDADDEQDEAIAALNSVADASDDEIEPISEVDSSDDDERSLSSEQTDDEAPSVGANKLSSGQDSNIVLPAVDGATIDDDAIEQIENTINETTEEFEQLSSQLLADLENASDEEAENPVQTSSTPVEAQPESLPSADDVESTKKVNLTDDNEPLPPAHETKASSPEINDPLTEAEQDDSVDDSVDELGDSIVDELEEEQASEELDELLEQFSNQPNSDLEDEISEDLEGDEVNRSDIGSREDTEDHDFVSDHDSDQVTKQAKNSIQDADIDLDNIEKANDDTSNPNSDLANELLSQLEADDAAEDDDLDALLAEVSTDSEARRPPDTNDTDARLDDIPSLNDMGKSAKVTEQTDQSPPQPEEPGGSDITKSTERADGEETTEHADAATGPERPKVLESTERDESAADPADNASDSELEDLSLESPLGSQEDDALADLPGLDDWLGNEDLDDDVKNIHAQDDIDSELNVLADIEGADFEELLSEIDAESLTQDKLITGQDDEPISNSLIETGSSDADLDIDELLRDDDNPDESMENFVNVDDLLSQSEALTPLDDEDIELDLNKSLGRMLKEGQNRRSGNADRSDENDALADIDNDVDDTISNQASNLDLAQVYIDMDDFEAAREVLEEVRQKGNQAQLDEAQELLDQIKS
jgi:pilus assembly protein FimV